MKITIEPSNGKPPYLAVTIDTLTDDEGTPEAVHAALTALIAFGHAKVNVQEACAEFGEKGDIEIV